MQTTLEKIRAHSPCVDGWTRLLTFLGKTKADNEPLPLSSILESNGLDDTLWCFQAFDGFEREKRLYVVWCARQVQHLMTDPRSLAALDVAEQFANSLASPEELGAASDAAARAAAWTAASDAAWAAAWAADADAATLAAAAWDAAAAQAQTQELKRVLACTEAGIDPYPPKEK